MTPAAFANPGRFFRGNLHTHSTRSDGALAPEEVCRRYAAQGYDFIALTDHFIGLFGYPIVDTRPMRSAGFTTILGAELHSGRQANGDLWHILAVGLPEDFTPPNAPHFLPVEDQETGPELAARARKAGAYVAIAHPEWSGLTEADATSIARSAHAVEVYNHGCVVGADRGQGLHCLDLLLSAGERLALIATDDAHFTEPDHFGGWVMVKAEANEPDALLDALKAGAMYASTGPEIHDLEITPKGADWGVLRIRMSACETVIVSGHGCAATALHGASMTAAEIKLDRFANSPFLRVTVVDAAGNRAWAQPIWKDDLA